MEPLVDYSTQARRTAPLVAATVCIVLFVLAAATKAPWYIWLFWCAATIGVIWALVANPRAGLSIHGGRLKAFHGAREIDIALDEITHVTIEKWSDGHDDVNLHLPRGEQLAVPGEALPPGQTLENALLAEGIEVRHL
ncbi:MAG: hypothetical protein AAGF74_14045 [Pseudomonadota bacterium]